MSIPEEPDEYPADWPHGEPGTQLWYVQNLLWAHGSKWGANDDWQCPAHADGNASLGVGQGEKGVVIHCSAGCAPSDVIEALGVTWPLVLGWEPGEPGTFKAPNGTGGGTEGKRRTIEELAAEHGGVAATVRYPYRDPAGSGSLARVVVRYDFADGTKTIRQRITPEFKDVAVLYKIKMVKGAISRGLPVYVVEGEKSADRLNEIAKDKDGNRLAVATTAPGGAGRWTEEHGALLFGAKRVVIVADRDEAGYQHANDVLQSLTWMSDVRVVRSRTTGKGDDLVDHLDAGFKVKDLEPVDLLTPFVEEPSDPDDEDPGEGTPQFEIELEGGGERKRTPDVWPSANSPRDVAEKLRDNITWGGVGRIRNWRDEWFYWEPEYGSYIQMEPKQFRGQLGNILADKRTTTAAAIPEIVPWNPTPAKLKGVMDMLDGLDGVFVPADLAPGYRFSHERGGDRLFFRDRVLDLTTGKAEMQSPDFFTLSALPHTYDPAATCPTWEQFLAETWPGVLGEVDFDSIRLLQEWFGYVLTTDTSAQKFLSLYGPPASGKTTIDSVLQVLLGSEAVAAVTIESLGKAFGLAQMAKAKLAVIGDASWSVRDNDAVVETIKGVTGNNLLRVEEKYEKAYSARPTARLMLVSNERPSLRDASGAIMRRLMVLETSATVPPERRSAGLLDRLVGEMPGILNWALVGLSRLRERAAENGGSLGAAFTVPPATAGEIEEIARAQSDIKAFVEERCEMVDDAEVPVQEFADEYRDWRKEQGIGWDITNAKISREMHAAFRHVSSERRGDPRKGSQRRHFIGVRMLPSATYRVEK